MARSFAFVPTIVTMLLVAATIVSAQNCQLPRFPRGTVKVTTTPTSKSIVFPYPTPPCAGGQYNLAFIDPTKDTLTSLTFTPRVRMTIPAMAPYSVATFVYTTLSNKIIAVSPGPTLMFESSSIPANYALLADRFNQKFGTTVVAADPSYSNDTTSENAAASWPIASVAACAFVAVFAAGVVTHRRRARATYTTLLGETTDQGYQSL